MMSMTMSTMDKCPIWPGFRAIINVVDDMGTFIVESARAGGKYEINVLARDMIVDLDLDLGARARLTTWLVDQRRLGVQRPKITKEIVEYAKVKRSLLPHERAARLLCFVAEQMNTIGTATYIYRNLDDGGAYAWSESTEWGELNFLLASLNEAKTLSVVDDGLGFRCMVTVNGYRQIAEQENHVATTQAFVAMWFHDETDNAFEHGIKPAIEAAGYAPLRIDHKPDLNKIDDEIIAEIRRSRFLVADFTQGEEGARGGVYFEAGFAEGLGIPVIYTCRNDMVGKLHFDTRQYAHIVWETPKELHDGLLNRILARIGEGPGSSPAR